MQKNNAEASIKQREQTAAYAAEKARKDEAPRPPTPRPVVVAGKGVVRNTPKPFG